MCLRARMFVTAAATPPRTHIPPLALVSVMSSLNMGLHQYISSDATWLFRLFRLTYFSYFRYFSRYSTVIWKCVEISKRIYKDLKKKVNGELINIGSCRGPPCNAVVDHQGAADPRLKTPVLGYFRDGH